MRANHALENSNTKVLIRTLDTGVMVLAITSLHTASQTLSVFHALTGCDTTSAFVGHGNKSSWSVWNAMPELTGAFLIFSSSLL